MGSRIWSECPQDRYEQTFDRVEQARFLAEAEALLERIHASLVSPEVRFTLQERTGPKAVWMLHLEAHATLRDCAALFREGRRRPAIKMLRDVFEALDLARFFH